MSGIAARFRFVNTIVFVLIIAFIAVVTVFVIIDIDSKASVHGASHLRNLLPLLISILAVLVLYALVQGVLMKRLFIKPLDKLFYDTTQEIKQHENILSAANLSADLLLRVTEGESFETSALKSMEVIGRFLDVDRVHIWQNEEIAGEAFIHIYEWLSETAQHKAPIPIGTRISYSDTPGWKNVFLDNGYISGPLSSLTQGNQDFFSVYDIKSVALIPLFLHDQFWGLFSIDDCHQERSFSVHEIDILRSVGLMIASSALRDRMTQDIRETAAKLEAVISNYSGIIWSVNKDNIITLLNGLYIKTLGLTPGAFEGWDLDEARIKNPQMEIISHVHKTIKEGPQSWISEIGNKRFHAYTTPIYDKNDSVSGVVGNVNDVTEIITLKEKLELALKKAQEADHAKNDFLAQMSHEMRTPLNAIIGLSDLVLAAKSFDEEERSNIEKVYNAGATLLSTVNDILDFSKIAAGKLELVPAEYDVPSLLNDTITQSIMHAGEKPIQFVLNIDENLPTRLLGDELRIKQMFNNLLSNAFKYTREGTVELNVSCNRQDENIFMTASVKDTGIGIKPESIDKIFEDYGQVDAKANHMIMGTGLGMPLTKRLIDLMGGTISVESVYGEGSTFTIKFQQGFVTDIAIGKEVVENLKNFHYSDHKRQRNSTLERIRLPYARILIVDDVVTNLDVARGLMKPYGMQIDCVTGGQDAVDAVRAEKVKYNAIFMDHMMPEMDGIEAAQIIRSIGTDYAKNIPIIALTANAIAGNEEMFLSKGFQAFLSKPIEIPKLDAVIRKWVRDKEQEKLYPKEKLTAEEQAPAADNAKLNELVQLALSLGVSGINIEKAVGSFGGDVDSYLEVLRSYTANTPPLLEASKTANVNKNDLDSYRITVHGIKGSSRGIGAGAVGDMAEALEKAAKAGDYDFIVSNNEAFSASAGKLISGINDILSQINNDNQRPKKDKPDTAVLQRLCTACKKYDIDGVEAAIDELMNYQYEKEGSELVDWLQRNVQLFNIKEIIAKLSGIPGIIQQ